MTIFLLRSSVDLCFKHLMFIADDNVRECVEEEMVIRIETLPSPDDLESHVSGMSPARQKNLFKLMYYRIAFKQQHISCR